MDFVNKVHVSTILAVVADLFESLWINVSQNVSESTERILEHIVPVVFSKVNNDWNQDREGLALVVLEDREEEIVFEEAHSSIRNLQVWTSNGLDQSLEKLFNVWFKLRNVTNIQNFK